MSNSIAIGVAYQDQDITGGSLNNSPIGATTPSTVVGTTVYATSEIGYSAAAQGAVTQATSKSTGVTLNKSAGRITMNAEALAGGAVSQFLPTRILKAIAAVGFAILAIRLLLPNSEEE
jgi:putative Ca2+/H+ antiporter (TMEM165/GDT1 family)